MSLHEAGSDFTAAVREVSDGFGSTWLGCDRTDPPCDLEVVRPGKAQCSDPCGHVGAYARIDALHDAERAAINAAKALVAAKNADPNPWRLTRDGADAFHQLRDAVDDIHRLSEAAS